MGSKRTLDLALSKLCHSQFLRKSGPNQKSYLFDSNGIKLKKKFEHCLTVDRIDLRRVYSDDEAENVLRNGQSAIQIPDNIKNIALKEKEIQQEDNDCKLKLWNLIQVSQESPSFQYQGYLRSRRQFWKQFMFNPGKISVKESPEKDSAIVNMDLEEYNEEIPPIELERIQTQTDHFVKEKSNNSRVFISYLSSQAGLMAVLLDSFRIRQFCKTPRLALNSKIAPIEVGIMISSSSTSDQKLKDLGRYIELNLTNEKINVLFGDNLQTFDDLGIPFVLMIDKNSFNQGVIQIRDRETTWKEQIHLAHVVPRMVKIFQHKEIPDTLTSVRQKYKLS